MNITASLINGGIIKRLQFNKPFYQQLFKNQFLSKSDTIMFDDVFEDFRGIARFVAPNVVSKVNQNKPSTLKVFAPAYIKEKDVIEAWSDELQSRVAGEDIGGSYSPQQRAMMVRAKQLRMHRQKIENRIELMCFQALAAGQVVVSGEDYPTVTVGYGRSSSLSQANLGMYNWQAATANPLTTLAQYSELVYDESNANIDTIIMGRGAWRLFYNYMTHKDRMHLFDNSIRGSDADMNLMFVGDIRGVSRVMRFTASNGQTMEIYVDNRSYIDENGVAQRFVADTEVFGFDSLSFAGVQAFGAIKDADAGYMPSRIFHKEFRVEEPSADFLLSQSAPLPIVLNPNTTFRILDVAS